jgi:hypothetical protein
MNLDYHLSLISFQLDEFKSELKKAELYEGRISSFRADEVLIKDCLEDNLRFLKRRSIVTSLEEYKAIRKNLINTIEVIKNYDFDLERLKISIQVQKEKINRAEEERSKIIKMIEQQKKGNVIPFKKK